MVKNLPRRYKSLGLVSKDWIKKRKLKKRSKNYHNFPAILGASYRKKIGQKVCKMHKFQADIFLINFELLTLTVGSRKELIVCLTL